MPKKQEKPKKRPLVVVYIPDDELKAQAKVKGMVQGLKKKYRLAFRNPNLFQPQYLVKNAEAAFIPNREKDKPVVEAYKKAKINVIILDVTELKEPKEIKEPKEPKEGK